MIHFHKNLRPEHFNMFSKHSKQDSDISEETPVEVEDIHTVTPPPENPPEDTQHHYEPEIDPESEFPWHRPEAQTQEAELQAPQIDMSNVNDPWKYYRGHIPAQKDLSYNQFSDSERVKNEEAIRQYAWKYQSPQSFTSPHIQSNEQANWEIQTQYNENAYQHHHEHIPQQHHEHNQHHDQHRDHQSNQHSYHQYSESQHRPHEHHEWYQHEQQSHYHDQGHFEHNTDQEFYSSHIHSHSDHNLEFPNHNDQSQHHDHQHNHQSQSYPNQHQHINESEQISDTHSVIHSEHRSVHQHGRYKHVNPYETYSTTLQVYHVHLDHRRRIRKRVNRVHICSKQMNGDISDTDSDEEFIIPRHPYDGFYLRHKATIDSRGRKICIHEMPLNPSPIPMPEELNPSRESSSPTPTEEFNTASECEDQDLVSYNLEKLYRYIDQVKP